MQRDLFQKTVQPPPESGKEQERESVDVKIEENWKKKLQDEFSKPYFRRIRECLVEEREKGHTIYPSGSQIFNAFNQTPFHMVKVVILGQDPYHGPRQANGLSFSVADGIRQPPSLQNIFKELKDDLGIDPPVSGNLEKWANQGVFLLNAVLTVRARQAASHGNFGWKEFTDAVIQKLSEERGNLVFILWGRFAQGKEVLIDHKKHLIIKSPHPSPFSAHSGFFGSRPFSRTNEYLQKHGYEPVDWGLRE